MSNFAFLQLPEWSFLFESATKAEELANTDARASCFYARRTLELAVAWLYKHDRSLRLPYQDNLSALIHEPTFRQTVGDALFTKARLIKDLGNMAVHSTKKMVPLDAINTTRELFHVCYWLARTGCGRSAVQVNVMAPNANDQVGSSRLGRLGPADRGRGPGCDRSPPGVSAARHQGSNELFGQAEG